MTTTNNSKTRETQAQRELDRLANEAALKVARLTRELEQAQAEYREAHNAALHHREYLAALEAERTRKPNKAERAAKRAFAG